MTTSELEALRAQWKILFNQLMSIETDIEKQNEYDELQKQIHDIVNNIWDHFRDIDQMACYLKS